MIFDTHSHYDDSQFDEDRDKLIDSFSENNISGAMAVGANFDDIPKIIAMCDKHKNLYPAIGVHPEYADTFDDVQEQALEAYISEIHPLAIGEIGLDYHYEGYNAEAQKKALIYQLELAEKYNLPVIIHSRDAAEETYNIIMDHDPNRHGVIHCFSGSPEMAERYIKAGYYIGIGGVVTFKNSKKLKEVAASIPLERILLETDCPYMAPVPHRGERNSSLFLPFVVTEIASLRGMSEEDLIKATEENAYRLFDIRN